MMPAAKHGDPQMGVDIHLCVVPPGVPTPLPTPHISVVFDPFDYLPIVGATITVCGMRRATAGTNGIVVHIPPGFPFAPKLPEKDDELFMGSATVIADGDPMSHISHPVLACQAAGMTSPFRIRKKGWPKLMVLPTVFNLAIPSTVVLGGPPTISLMGLAFKGLFAALGKFAKSKVFKRMRQRLFKNLKPGILKCLILKAEPVNILNGSVSIEQEDFSLPGRIPIRWLRTYGSADSYVGWCGPGWQTIADIRLEVDPHDGTVLLQGPEAGPLVFDRVPAGEGEAAAETEPTEGARLVDEGHAWSVTTTSDRVYRFPKGHARTDSGGQRRVAIGSITDRCGNALHFEYRNGRPVAVNESAGRRLVFTIERGRLTAVTLHVLAAIAGEDIRRVLVRYEYDQAGDLVAVFDAMEQPYRFAYENHRVVRHTDRTGLAFQYEYEKSPEDDWRVSHAFGDGGLYDYRFEYIDALNERRITDSLGHLTIVKLDDRGLPISEIDPLGGNTIYEYDDAGRTTAVVDPASHRTEYAYDDRGNLLAMTRPDGKAVVTVFDADSRATEVAGPDGARWQQEWDVRGLLVRQTTPLGAESRYEYDTLGQLSAFIDPRAARTELAYDPAGNLTRLTDALGHTTTFSYDGLGNVAAKTDPLGHITRYGYDAKNRLVSAQLPGGSTILCAYDAEDNLIGYVDENGAETRLEYTGLGEIKRRLQPDGHTVEYHYDTEERLIGVTNQRGETYRLNRDALGRIVEEVDYWGQARKYRYTACGHLVQSEDPLGRAILYQTDRLGRIQKKILPDPGGGGKLFVEFFEYDANGNLTACVNPHIRVERTFDAEGRLVEERQGPRCAVASAYDANGNRISRTTTRQIGGRSHTHTVRYAYDALDQAIRVEAEGQAPIELTRDALGQLTEERLSARLRRRLDYSADGYLTSQQVTAAERPLFDQTYRYDRAGNLIEKRDSQFGLDQYTYDPLGRMIAHLDPQQRLKRYLNDPAGDRLRTRVREPGPGEAVSDWRRDGEYGGISYRFDRAGNLVRREGPDGGLELIWDANQRLVESRAGGKSTTYRYDPLGRRISKQTGGKTTHFCWDGDALSGDATVADFRDSGPVLRLLREWIYYPGTFEPLALVRSCAEEPDVEAGKPRFYLYHNDPNGCPTGLMDARGMLVWAARYTAWGGVAQVLAAQVDNPLRLQGQYEDRETGLHYNRYRYFDPLIGQFISQDPLRLLAGPHVYEYAGSALASSDPLGLACKRLRDASGKFRKAVTSAEELSTLTRLTNKSRAEIERALKKKGYSGVPAHSGGTVLTKALPDGNTVAVRLDPPVVRTPPKGWADEVAHAHKEVVPTSAVTGGNYPPSAASKFTDLGTSSTGPADAHIPIKR